MKKMKKSKIDDRASEVEAFEQSVSKPSKELLEAICTQAFTLYEKRSVALRLAAGEQKWMASGYRRMNDARTDRVRYMGDEASGLSDHAQALSVLLTQVECFNVAIQSLAEVAKAAGVDLVKTMSEHNGGFKIVLEATASET